MAKRMIHLLVVRIAEGIEVHRYDSHCDRDEHWEKLTELWRLWNIEKGKDYADPMMWRHDILVPFELDDDDEVGSFVKSAMHRAALRATLQRVANAVFADIKL